MRGAHAFFALHLAPIIQYHLVTVLSQFGDLFDAETNTLKSVLLATRITSIIISESHQYIF